MDPSRDGARMAALNRELDRDRPLPLSPVPETEVEAEPIKRSPSVFADYVGEYRGLTLTLTLDDVREGRNE